MDPFNKLPPEIHLHIFICLRTRSKRSILPLVQASPTMLQQYITSKLYIIRSSLATDLDDDMIQDAMRIILFPVWTINVPPLESSDNMSPSWPPQQLPNPFKIHGLIEKIDKLHSRLLLFIEDYLTKATAKYPPRECRCLPRLSSNQLVFKDQTVCLRFDAVALTTQERRRILRAFLRYELICKLYRLKQKEAKCQWNIEPLLECGGHIFQPSEREAIRCAHRYLKSLYGATNAQYGDSWLPNIPKGTLYSFETTGLLYPDNLYVDADVCGSGFNLFSPHLACFGFDLATTLIQSATSGQHNRDYLEQWFYDTRTYSTTKRYPDWILSSSSDIYCQNGPGLYQELYPRLTYNQPLQLEIYRQRAWVFLDDARFSFGSSPHFPTSDELDSQSIELAKIEEWFLNPHPTRARNRSQKWHDEQRASVDNDQRVNDAQASGLKMECQTPLIPLPPASAGGSTKIWLRSGNK
ncbi:hypothetical protein EDB80DRAFT_873919 [Ilyonectria destructans]|nr:hypothetical protein EDB80DRAFT_873919 [Ilyonectria destructans]